MIGDEQWCSLKICSGVTVKPYEQYGVSPETYIHRFSDLYNNVFSWRFLQIRPLIQQSLTLRKPYSRGNY